MQAPQISARSKIAAMQGSVEDRPDTAGPKSEDAGDEKTNSSRCFGIKTGSMQAKQIDEDEHDEKHAIGKLKYYIMVAYE